MKHILVLLALFSSCLAQTSIQQYMIGMCDKPAVITFTISGGTYTTPTAYVTTSLNQISTYSIFCVNGVGLYMSKGLTFDTTSNDHCRFSSPLDKCTTVNGETITITGMYQMTQIGNTVFSGAAAMLPSYFN